MKKAVEKGNPTELFEIVNDFMGWGDSSPGSLCFIGIEGGAAYKKENIGNILAEKHLRFVAEKEWNWKGLKRKGAGIRDFTSKIAQPLSTAYKNSEWDLYRNRMLWGEHSKVFQLNLYPLGKPNIKSWMADYEEMFGFGPRNREHYMQHVRETRFPKINEFRNERNPQATVRFGSSYSDDFIACLSLENETSEWLDVGKKIQCFDKQKVLIVPFFGNARMTDALVDVVVQRLSNWNVRLP